MCLNFCRPAVEMAPPAWNTVTTPLQLPTWKLALRSHPDQAFAQYIIKGITEGFRIGYSRQAPLKSAQQNMYSAREHPEIIQDYLHKECARGRMLGPFCAVEMASLPPCHVNRFGVIPKGHNTGKWRLITDLSFPPGASVNDGIDPETCSLSYTTVEQVAEVAAKFGRGALLAKIDIESAYRLVPVHPSDRHLQAVRWNNATFVGPYVAFRAAFSPENFQCAGGCPRVVCTPSRGQAHIPLS